MIPADEIPFAPEMPKVDALRFVTAIDFAAVDEEDSAPLAGDGAGGVVIPAGAFVLVYGDGGAGKTTLVLDLVVHLATGKAWLDLVVPERPLRVALVENEGPRPMFRLKLRRKLEPTDTDAGESILILEEPWQGMSFREALHRDALVRLVEERELDLLVASPLSRLGMEGGGTLDEIGAFIGLLADVQRRAIRPLTILLVHHENRAGRISGAWEGSPDLLVHVAPEGNGRTRVFWQKARWSSTLHGKTTRLAWADGESFTVDTREEITEATMADEILAAALELPGGSWTKIRGSVRGNETEKAAVRDRLIRDGLLLNQAARKGQFELWSASDPAATRSELRTGVERPPFPSPETEAADVPVPPFQRSIGTGELERNGRRGSTQLENCIRCGSQYTVDDARPELLRCPRCVGVAA